MRTFHKVFGMLLLFVLAISINPTTAMCDTTFQVYSKRPEDANSNKDLSADEIKALDSDLAKALTLYYDEEYEKALPVFQNIARHRETFDLIFLLGKCEAKIGEYESSIGKFQQLLSKNPDLHRVRLALADSLIMSERYREASAELKKIRETSMSRPILDAVAKRFTHIAGIKKFHWRLNFFLGGEYDDNINSGPDRSEIDTIDGGLPLPEEQKETDSYNFITGFRYAARYDLGKPRGVFWNSAVDFYYSRSEEDSDYNYLSIDLSTGPWLFYSSGILKIPFGYTDTRYGEEHLSGIFYFQPEIEHFFNKNFSIQGAYTLATENYTHAAYREYDNALNRISIGPNIYFDDTRHIFSGALSFEYRNADADRTSFDAVSISLSYFTRFSTDMEFLLKYIWRERQYDGHSQYYQDDREDRRNTFIASIAQEFSGHFFVSFECKYIDNSSNDALFDFAKTVYSLKMGTFF